MSFFSQLSTRFRNYRYSILEPLENAQNRKKQFNLRDGIKKDNRLMLFYSIF